MDKRSRIRQYVDRLSSEKVDVRVADLEHELDEEQRRSLRLTRRLEEETALRARAERLGRESEQELEIVQEKLSQLEKTNERSTRASKSRKRAGTGGTVPDSPQRVDGGTAPKRKSRAKPVDSVSDKRTDGPAKSTGSRKRGNVK